jgi:large subunit ribosomal protein L4
VFAAPVKQHLFWEVVRMQLANRRSGTAKTKRIGEIQGTRKKPYKQKGTGRARHGSMRTVGMRGGAVVHGPQPRDYSYKMPKKMVLSALRSALSLRNGEKALFVVSGWSPSTPKTKAAAQVLKTFGSGSALVVGDGENAGLAKSLRNLPRVKFLPHDAVNVYDILAHDHLFITDTVVQKLVDRLKASPSRKERGETEEA